MLNVERIIGKGAYGDIYLATTDDGREIALKANYVRERGALGSLREYDTLLKVSDCKFCVGLEFAVKIADGVKPRRDDSLRDTRLFCMKLGDCDGKDFIRDPSKTIHQRKSFLLQVALGLEFLHSRGITHFDVKPRNIIFYRGKEGSLGVAKLGDFGMSTQYSLMNYCDGDAYTPCYRAPEIANSEIYTSKVDVWAFGILAIECITGRTPLIPEYEGTRVLNRIIENFSTDEFYEGGPKDVSEILPREDENIRELVNGLTITDPNKRWDISRAINSSFFSDGEGTFFKDLIETSRGDSGINRSGVWVTKPLPVINVAQYQEGNRNIIFDAIMRKRRRGGAVVKLQALDMLDRYLYATNPVNEISLSRADGIAEAFLSLSSRYFSMFAPPRGAERKYSKRLLSIEDKVLSVLEEEGFIVRYSYAEMFNETHVPSFRIEKLYTLIGKLSPGTHLIRDIINEARGIAERPCPGTLLGSRGD